MPALSASELHTRREALAFSISQARLMALTMWLIVCVVTWLGWRAGVGTAAAVFFGLGAVTAVWRFAVLRHFGDPRQLDEPTLVRAERLILANMLFAGLTWTFATITVYPRLDVTGTVVYVAIQFATVTFSAFFMSTIAHGFVLHVAPMMTALFVVNVLRGDTGSWVLAALVAAYIFVMTRASRRFRDITVLAFRRGFDMQAANTELRQAIAEAESATRAKTRFLATMSHELRTPMNGMLGALDLLSRAPVADAERRLVEMARASGEGLLAVLNDVLDYAKIDAGQIAVRTGPMALRELVESVVGLFTPSALAKGLRLTGEVAADVPPRVLADEQRLRQVLLNLVGNAVKFTPHGAIEIRVSPAPAGLRFEVRDTGIGIAPEARRELFQPFRQVDERSNRAHGGTGLGLAISHRLVQAMGGQIDVHSVPGQGSCFGFTLELPVLQGPAAPSDSAEPAAPPALPPPPLSGRVLVAEDNPVNLCLAVEMLRQLGLQPVEAHDGVEALSVLHSDEVDLALMDCEMPRKDGYEAVREWRAHEAASARPRLPILAVTANVMAEDMQRAHACGMDGVLGKPFTFEQLRDALRAWSPAQSRRV